MTWANKYKINFFSVALKALRALTSAKLYAATVFKFQ